MTRQVIIFGLAHYHRRIAEGQGLAAQMMLISLFVIEDGANSTYRLSCGSNQNVRVRVRYEDLGTNDEHEFVNKDAIHNCVISFRHEKEKMNL